MPFVEPIFLWGALTVIIPVAIHFWHQKQGKPLPWAATQWLIEKQQQQSRGLRLDNILLLIIRCLLLVLLALLLAQPILTWLQQTPIIERVHLVQPNSSVVNNFRFELTEALKKGEKVVWADERQEPLNSELKLPEQVVTFSPLLMQGCINQIDDKNAELNLYTINNQILADVPAITVPAQFRLHTLIDSTSRPKVYLSAKGNRKLFINRAGKLTTSPMLGPTLKFQSEPVHSGPVRTLLTYRNERERQTVKAALAALTDVYELDLLIDEKRTPGQLYDWVLTDQLPKKPSPKTLYIISSTLQHTAFSNVIFTNELLTPQTSERVENGQLPEWLGEQFLQHYTLTMNEQPLSQQDLNALFISTTKPTTEQHAGIQNALLLLFIVLVVFERWLALTKNA